MIIIPKNFTMAERSAVWSLAGKGFQVTLDRGNKPDVARFIPPLIVKEKDIDRALDVLGKVLKKRQ